MTYTHALHTSTCAHTQGWSASGTKSKGGMETEALFFQHQKVLNPRECVNMTSSEHGHSPQLFPPTTTLSAPSLPFQLGDFFFYLSVFLLFPSSPASVAPLLLRPGPLEGVVSLPGGTPLKQTERKTRTRLSFKLKFFFQPQF